jgi:ABC-type uncharacterized transport system involved in gliding motility auxiliary subunit
MEQNKIKNQSQLVVYILIILGFVGVINYVSTIFFSRIDLTEKKMYSVSKATKSTLKKLDDIVNIRVCFSKNLPPNLKSLQSDVKDLLSEYKAYSGKNLHITYEDPSVSEAAKQKIKELGVPELQMQTYEKDKAQVINGFMGIIVQYADKKRSHACCTESCQSRIRPYPGNNESIAQNNSQNRHFENRYIACYTATISPERIS